MTNKKTRPAARKTIAVELRNGIGIIALNRPDVHNAFDEVLIEELTQAARELADDERVRAVILTGNGPSFCAGADLTWMKKMAAFSRAQNVADATALAEM